ncbi:TetR family transcriptional regulator [Stappia sp. GBMRC 2046]|uniref:TetR family transcriptional regulator n=1 Tax=Stappia sediminis TaxID=2692190 RepID=A0A7X3LTE7_9HYPH|nr:TetR/AcrR family transcriptional regulator [Stappia sediminis]MXN64774.1 TetR family transcriptional regulator [Stappia sediminis]
MGRKKSYDRADALDKAMREFWKSGYEGAHLATLVERTGMNRFSLYKEFGGKAGLFEEALAAYLDEARGRWPETLLREPLGIANIRRYFATIEIDGDYKGCFVINTLTDKAVAPKTAYSSAEEFIFATERLLLQNLDAAKADGDLHTDADTRRMAQSLATLDAGLSVYGIVRPDTRTAREIAATVLDSLFGPHHDG